jgi:dihydrofolate synthase/folylpolyglutamate synthase
MNLTQWLEFIGQVHPREIELGLERSRRVASRLGIKKAPLVITVAGTNGKGTIVGVMEQCLCQFGIATGCYTSPHIDSFNERIRVQGKQASDPVICDAFAQIEAVRGDVTLSYFEFATLAALLIFQQQEVEVALLEVGLGGRLDAVNIINPDVSVIATIGLDHQDWLGHDRDTISLEKAGILRAGGWFVCADSDPPAVLQNLAAQLNCRSLYVGRQFSIQQQDNSSPCWHGQSRDGADLAFSLPPFPGLLADNVAAAVQALVISGLDVDWISVTDALRIDVIPGRQELRRDSDSGCRVLLDVAHNPHAMAALASRVAELRDSGQVLGKIRIVLAIMGDKDVDSMLDALESTIDFWYIAQVEESRCMSAVELENRLQRLTSIKAMTRFESVQKAYRSACVEADEEDLVVIAGSFFTVAAVRKHSLDTNSKKF